MGAAEYARLEKTLLARGLAPIELERARATAKQFEGNIASALVARRSLSEDEVTAALAETFRVPKWDGRVDADSARVLGADRCWEKFVVPVERKGNRLVVAVADPTDLQLHTDLRFISGARVIDVVVGAEPALARALNGLFPLKLPAELVAELADHVPLPGDDWEQQLRELLASFPLERSSPGWVATYLIKLLARGEVSQLRFELGPASLVVARTESSQWAPVGLLSGVTLSPRFLLEVASHFTFMAGLPLGLETGFGSMKTRTSTNWHGGSDSSFDVAVDRTVAGPVVVVTEAIARPHPEKMSIDHGASRASRERGRVAVEQRRFADAHRELAVAMERAFRVDGAVGLCSMPILWTLEWAYRSEGRLAEAAQAIGQAAACSDVPPFYRALAQLDASHCTQLLGQHLHSAGHARAALESALDLFGSPGNLAALAALQLARAQLATGSTTEAQQLAASLTQWAPSLDATSRNRAAWLEGLVLFDKGDLSGAEAKLRPIATSLETDGDEDGLLTALLLDLYDVVTQQKGDVLEVLERAVKSAADLAPLEPQRARAERELARLKGSR